VSASVTAWWRIEPQSDDLVPGPDRALQARVYDPAWMLGRQWQLGELGGEDAASPAWVRLRVAAAPLTRLQLGSPDGPVQALGRDDLLEPLVEGEADQASGWAAAVAAGAHFLEGLHRAGLDGLAQAFRDAYPLPDPGGADPAARRRWRVLRRHGLDGATLRAAALTSAGNPRLPARPELPQDRRDAVLDVVRQWLAWYPDPPEGAGTGWVPERLEYRFAVAAPDPTGADREVVLEAPAYEGGTLDWDDLRAAPADRSLGAAGDEGRAQWAHRSLPTRVAYPGMPANRWWELEDAQVSFGHVEAEGGDLARLLTIEFATVYGNDWFLAPCDVPLGSVLAVQALVVADTFGQETLVTPAVAPGFAMFAVSGADPGTLVLPPVLGPGLQGAAVEEVQLARDEAANMGWAIERVVTGEAGNRVDRHEVWRDRLAAQPAVPSADLGPDTLVYTLAHDPPDHWIPLVPRSDGPRAIGLHRGEIVHGDGRAFGPLGRLLEPGRPLVLFEEELPRSGLLATRAWQFARTAGGRSVAWIGRRTRPGRGESASALGYDRLAPPD
jgi:hypothetical protein